MPRKRKNEVIPGQYFTWKLTRRNAVYQADGRTNPTGAGRHSLGTKDRTEALEALKQLDLVQAVELGLADRKLLREANVERIDLEEGRQLYMASVAAPEVAGGASEGTCKRYRPVFDKFVSFAESQGVTTWGRVNARLLKSYGAWLDDRGYAERTLYLELTTIIQAVKYLVLEGYLPESCRISLSLTKSIDSPTYCYLPEEVDAIVAVCMANGSLVWLGQVVIALACTGMRISELAALRWTDVDFVRNVIRVANDPSTRKGNGKRRRTKNRRDRSFPINDQFLEVLKGLPRHQDGRVFHGPLGGVLKPDTVRNNLTGSVLPVVAKDLRSRGMETEVLRGRLHSFRHFFCSECANNNVPMQMVMDWLGHQDSRMVRYYCHLADKRSQQEMKQLTFVKTDLGEADADDVEMSDETQELVAAGV